MKFTQEDIVNYAKGYGFIFQGSQIYGGLSNTWDYGPLGTILRRAGMELSIVSISGDKKVTGSHNITIIADELIEEHDFADDDVLVIPGGMPGTNLIEANELAQAAIKLMSDNNKYVCAICAAPKILGHGGFYESFSSW